MSSSKRKHVHEGQSSKPKKKKEKFYSDLFRTKEHEKHFEEVVQGRKLLMERRVELQPGEALDFQFLYLSRRWKKLGTYPQPANVAVVKEFYANAMCLDVEEGMRLYSYVRGHRVPYDAATINEFLGTELGLHGEHCQYRELHEAGADHEEIERTVCRPGGHFTRTRQGLPQHIKRSQLTPTAMIWMTFIHANLSPCVHVSDITEARSIILYSIMAGLTIDIGRLIADEIWQCANGSSSSSALGHPSLITHLCTMAGVDTAHGPTERPRHPIDIKYVNQYCMRGAEAPPPPVMPPAPLPPRPAAARRAAADQAAQDIGAAIIRGQVVLLDCLRALATTIHPPPAIPSVEDFMRIVAWPGDRPIFPEGAAPADADGARATDEGDGPVVRENVVGDAAAGEVPADSERDPVTDADAVQEDLAAIATIATSIREEAEAEIEAEGEREPAGTEIAEAAVIEPTVEESASEFVEPEARAAVGEEAATETMTATTPEDDSPTF